MPDPKLGICFKFMGSNWILSAILSTLICIGLVDIVAYSMNLLRIKKLIFKPYSFMCKRLIGTQDTQQKGGI